MKSTRKIEESPKKVTATPSKIENRLDNDQKLTEQGSSKISQLVRELRSAKHRRQHEYPQDNIHLIDSQIVVPRRSLKKSIGDLVIENRVNERGAQSYDILDVGADVPGIARYSTVNDDEINPNYVKRGRRKSDVAKEIMSKVKSKIQPIGAKMERRKNNNGAKKITYKIKSKFMSKGVKISRRKNNVVKIKSKIAANNVKKERRKSNINVAKKKKIQSKYGSDFDILDNEPEVGHLLIPDLPLNKVQSALMHDKPILSDKGTILKVTEFVQLNYVNHYDNSNFHPAGELMEAECIEHFDEANIRFIRIPPGGRKRTSRCNEHSYCYYVAQGRGIIHLHKSVSTIKVSDNFVVPKSIAYSIRNTSTTSPLSLGCIKL